MIGAVKRAAASGAASGGLVGFGTSLLGGGGVKTALRNAMLGSLAGGTLAGGGVGVGTAVMGEPDEGEVSPYTHRGATGGAIVGGGLGSLLGAALAKRYLKVPPKFDKIAELAAGRHPGIAALLGGAAGAAAGAYQAGDEGMQVDFIQNELDAMRRKRQKAKTLGE